MPPKKKLDWACKVSKDLDINMKGHEEPVGGKRKRNQTKFHLDEVVAEFEKKTPRVKKQATPPANHHFGVAFRSFPGLIESPSGGFPARPEPVPQFSVQNNAGHFHYYQQFMGPPGSAGIPEPAAYHVLPRPAKLLPYRSVDKANEEKPASPEKPVPHDESELPVTSKLSGRVRQAEETESDADDNVPSAVALPVDVPVQSVPNVIEPAVSVQTEVESDPDDEIPIASSEMLHFNELIPGASVTVIDGLLDAVGLVHVVTGKNRHLSARLLRRVVDDDLFDSSNFIEKASGTFLCMYCIFFINWDYFGPIEPVLIH